ncbi:MAG TPA: hypothetical protein DGG95_12095, partial [Cytophagales bacterium]|nr:hypothetical protein [Cytophagales bacterium]
EAVGWYKKLLAFNDSLVNLSNAEKVTELTALYDLDSKEAAIRSLKSINEAKEKEIVSQNAALRAQRTTLLFSLVFSLILLVGGLVLFRFYQTKKQLNRELVELNKEIQEQAEEIQTQSEELLEANEGLVRLNEELKATQEEIVAQNEELIQSHEEISAQRDLVATQNEALEKAKLVIEAQRNEIAQRNEFLEEEVESRTKELVAYNNQLEQFAFVSSHNLRAPVARILGLTNLLNTVQISENERQYILDKLQVSAKELDQIIHDLNFILEIKKNTSVAIDAIDLKEEVERIKVSLGQEIENTNAEIAFHSEHAPTLVTVRPYLYSILMNLISNAIKYRHPKRTPVVTIRSENVGDFVFLSVNDNGIGMDLSKYEDKLFKLYQRFHTHVDGKGMGLYLVKTQVEALGGSIVAESRVNEGTTFRVYLKNQVNHEMVS